MDDSESRASRIKARVTGAAPLTNSAAALRRVSKFLGRQQVDASAAVVADKFRCLVGTFPQGWKRLRRQIYDSRRYGDRPKTERLHAG